MKRKNKKRRKAKRLEIGKVNYSPEDIIIAGPKNRWHLLLHNVRFVSDLKTPEQIAIEILQYALRKRKQQMKQT